MYSTHFTILARDVDANQIARPSSVIGYMQEAADRHMHDAKPGYMDLFREGKAFILARMNMAIYQPLHIYDEIDVDTWPSESRGVIFYRSYRIRRGKETVAEGTGVWALVDIATKRFFKCGEVDLSNYGNEEPLQTTYSKRVRLDADMHFDKAGQYMVSYGDVDCNLHMNNANYADKLTGFIGDFRGLTATDVTLNFVSEAPLGSSIDVYVSAPVVRDGKSVYYFKTMRGDVVNVEAEIAFRKI